MSALLILSNTVANTSIASVFGVITAPLQETGAALVDEERYADMTKEELMTLIARTSEENSIMRQQLVDYYELKQKNEQFAKALKIQEKNLDLELTPAAVTGRDPADVFGSFTIDLGYLDGVKIDDPVITDKGLVGIVTEVFALSSKVSTILSEDVKAGATAKELRESGVVTGEAEAAASGNVRLDYLDKSSKVQKGTIITTSGSGGVFPKDIIIGKVAYLGSSQTDVSLYAVVEPFEDIKTVTDVFIITNFPGKDEEAAQPVTEDGEGSK